MNARTRAIHDDLAGAHAETWPILSGLSPDDLQVELYVEGETGWRVREAVAHLADAQRGLLGQIRRLVVGEATVPEGFDLNRWNRGAVRRRAEKTFEELLEELRSGHEEALAYLPTLSDEALDRRGRHPGGEWLTAEGYFHRMANHRREHVADISRALGKPDASR
jgi:hypothetical protein